MPGRKSRTITLARLLVRSKAVPTIKEARHLIANGGVLVGDKVATDPEQRFDNPERWPSLVHTPLIWLVRSPRGPLNCSCSFCHGSSLPEHGMGPCEMFNHHCTMCHKYGYCTAAECWDERCSKGS